MCIYGASYGAYAALEGVSKEPALYKCAVGYVGVYDLPLLVADDSDKSTRAANWTKDWIGTDPAELAKVSPNLHADRIKVPVFLAAGGEDKTAPIKHTEKMEAALKNAGASVETLYFPPKATASSRWSTIASSTPACLPSSTATSARRPARRRIDARDERRNQVLPMNELEKIYSAAIDALNGAQWGRRRIWPRSC